MQEIIISPSILSADFSKLEQEISKIEKAGAAWLHLDIMDGHFVHNITIGSCIVKSIRPKTSLFFDAHLMISEPQKYWRDFQKAGADLITFHFESDFETTADKKKLIDDIKNNGIKAGLAIKPKTSISDIVDLLPLLDLVLIMTVEPGFSGQTFMENQVEKIKELKKTISKNNFNCLIEVDGGINAQTAKNCIEAGVDVLASGNFVFLATDAKKAIDSLRNASKI